ncbi:MAG TPA: nuclear transport factor 2 family protein [Xanthomonadaceae bacterium]|nr:nuclear transport factor 2 family protein [Xanthomonadaceae bacterium]
MKHLKRATIVALIPAAALWLTASARGTIDHGDVVRNFIEAFNARDMPALMALAHPEIEWLSVNGTDILVEARGAPALESSLVSYFQSCESCRSAIEVTSVNGNFVTAVETASWTSAGTTRSQSSTSVYELVDAKVRRVWYFPAIAR